MSTEVFSTPCFPMPMETSSDPTYEQFLAQFLNGIPGVAGNGPSQPAPMFMEQPPQQPMLDNPPCGSVAASTLVKQERASGFLDVWAGVGLQQEEDINRYSPEEKKRYESLLIKEELSCHIKLKMMKEGKDFSSEAEDQPSTKDHPISEETKQLQKLRREKNRAAAKKCRQKKKVTEREMEMKVRESEKQVREMQQQLSQSRQDFSCLLENFHSIPCFIAYLRQNRHLLQSQLLKPALQRFLKTHGHGVAMTNRCSVCPGVQQTLGFSIEQ